MQVVERDDGRFFSLDSDFDVDGIDRVFGNARIVVIDDEIDLDLD